MPDASRRPGRRPLWIVLLLLVLAAGALWGASRLTWQWAQHPSDLRGTVTDVTGGATAEPALVPLALLYLAAIAAAVATGGWLRRVVGVLVLLAGVAAGWLSLRGIGAVSGTHPPGYPLAAVLTGHLLALLAGLLALGAGVVLLRRGATMPRMGVRYQAPGAARRLPDKDKQLWDELSEGHDPTDR